MRAAARLALVTLLLAACGGKKEGGAAGSAAASADTVAPVRRAVPDHVALPALAAGSRAENVPDGPTAFASASAIVVEGMSMVAIDGGKVDAAQLEGGAMGMRIPRLAAWATEWSKLPEAASAKAFVIGLDPALPSAVTLQVLWSLKPAGLRRFAFLVRTPDGVGTVPLELPETPAPTDPAAPAANPEDAPLGLVVTLMPDHVVVWSMSQLEGTLKAPKAVLKPGGDGAWLTKLRDTLTDIRQRRWGGGIARPDHQKDVIVMVDAMVASGDLVNAIAAVRTDAKGEELFPDVRIATGFDAPAVAATTKPPPAAPPPPSPPGRKADESIALQEEAAAAMAVLLSAEEGSESGPRFEMEARRPGSDLGAQLEAVKESGATVAVGGGGGARVDGPADGSAKTPTGRVTVAAKTAFDDTSLTADVVQQKVMNAYMSGLKRCYKDTLKQDATARGAVVLYFTVESAGRTTAAKVTGFASELDACVQGQMSSWRFPVPKDADGEATEASFQIKLQLVPD